MQIEKIRRFCSCAISKVFRWAQCRSLSAINFHESCCSIASLYQKHGDEYANIALTNSPKHADLLIVSGHISEKMFELLREYYDQIPAPKYVMIVGDCAVKSALRDGMLLGSIPVDIVILGCPVTADVFHNAIEELKGKISYDTRSC